MLTIPARSASALSQQQAVARNAQLLQNSAARKSAQMVNTQLLQKKMAWHLNQSGGTAPAKIKYGHRGRGADLMKRNAVALSRTNLGSGIMGGAISGQARSITPSVSHLLQSPNRRWSKLMS